MTEPHGFVPDDFRAGERGGAHPEEASEIAKRAGRSVVFHFNGEVVTVSPGDDPSAVARSWWKKVFGETPEQTAAQR